MAEQTPLRDRRPLSQQLRDRILETIFTDGLRPGDQIPPEAALSERFQVGRSTVREALKLLERDGLIDVRHGRGSFVSARAELRNERPITQLESVTDLMRGLGYVVDTRVLGVGERAPDDEERATFSLPPAEHVVSLERLRLHDGSPFIYSLNVIPRRLLPGPPAELDWSGSLLELLEAAGHRAVSSVAHIHSVDPPERLRALGSELEFELSDEPWLLITEICVTELGRPILAANDYHRGDVFAFHMVRHRRHGTNGV